MTEDQQKAVDNAIDEAVRVIDSHQRVFNDDFNSERGVQGECVDIDDLNSLLEDIRSDIDSLR